MKKPKTIADPRIGKHVTLDPDVRLNIIPGRKLAKLVPLSLGSNARIRSGSVLYASSQIGSGFETGHHVVVREENRIGQDVSVWNNTTIDYGCRIGNRVKIHCNCYIAQFSVLEDDVFVAPGTIFANDLFPINKHSARLLQGPILKKGAKIGVNVTILPGVVIGKNALVGAGSVVTQDVPDNAVVWGSPAKIHKRKSDLRWPQHFSILRPVDQRFYKNTLAGRAVFERE